MSKIVRYTRYTIGACIVLLLFVLPYHSAQANNQFSTTLQAAAQNAGIPPALFAALIEHESGFDPNTISSTGCAGLGQICRRSEDPDYIRIMCDQTEGPHYCDRTRCTTEADAAQWCEQCPSSAGTTCVPDDRYDPTKNLYSSATTLASKVRQVIRAGCDLNTEAGIKAAIYSYNMGAGRLEQAIEAVGCADYGRLYAQAYSDFEPLSCTDDDCRGTCGSHPEFPGSQLCIHENELYGTLYGHDPITLSKLQRKSNEPGSYVTNIFASYLAFGGTTGAGQMQSLTLRGGSMRSSPSQIPEVIVDVPTLIPKIRINIPGLTFTPQGGATEQSNGGGRSLMIPYISQYIAAIYRYATAVAIILASVIMIASGIQWSTSGGGDGVQAAKKRVIESLLAMVLIASSYVLLRTINPSLVQLGPLNVRVVESSPLTAIIDRAPGTNELGISDLSGLQFTVGAKQGECVEQYTMDQISASDISRVNTLPLTHYAILTDFSSRKVDQLHFDKISILDLFDVSFSYENNQLRISDSAIFGPNRTSNTNITYLLQKARQENPNISIVVSFSAVSPYWTNKAIQNVDGGKDELLRAIDDLFRVYPDIDGFSLNFEHPSEHIQPSVSKQEFVSFLQELRDRYPNTIFHTYGFNSPGTYAYDWPSIFNIVDYVTIMTYTVYTPKRSDVTGPYNPLFGAEPFVERYAMDAFVQSFNNILSASQNRKLIVAVSPVANSFPYTEELWTPGSRWAGSTDESVKGSHHNKTAREVQQIVNGQSVCLHPSGVKYAGVYTNSVPTQYWFDDYETYRKKMETILEWYNNSKVGGFAEWTINIAGPEYWKAIGDVF